MYSENVEGTRKAMGTGQSSASIFIELLTTHYKWQGSILAIANTKKIPGCYVSRCYVGSRAVQRWQHRFQRASGGDR